MTITTDIDRVTIFGRANKAADFRPAACCIEHSFYMDREDEGIAAPPLKKI